MQEVKLPDVGGPPPLSKATGAYGSSHVAISGTASESSLQLKFSDAHRKRSRTVSMSGTSPMCIWCSQ